MANLVRSGPRHLSAKERRHYRHKVVIEPPYFPQLMSNGAVADRIRPTLMLRPAWSRDAATPIWKQCCPRRCCMS